MTGDSALPTISTETFFVCELRAGTVMACSLNPKARKPAYRLEIDFGPHGRRSSSAQLTQLYTPEQMLGRQIVAVVNFAPRNVAGVESQCLVLGTDTLDGVVLLALERAVENGARVY